MTWSELNLCRVENAGYRAVMGGMSRRVLGVWVALAVALLAPSVASAAPAGTVAGWRSPAAGVLELSVLATPGEAHLRSATATLGGTVLAVKAFDDGSCTEICPATLTLPVDTKRVPDGQRVLVVTVEDVNGVDSELFRRTLSIENAPRVFTPTVTVQIGSGPIPPPPLPGGSVGGDAGPTCASPRLTMRLAQRPLRYRRGVPVLAAGRKYRYKGRLTCRINGRRRAAPRGMRVQVRNRLRGSTISKPSIRVRRRGAIVVRLAYRRSRVLIFRVVGAGGDAVRVRIPIRVVRVKKARR